MGSVAGIGSVIRERSLAWRLSGVAPAIRFFRFFGRSDVRAFECLPLVARTRHSHVQGGHIRMMGDGLR